MLRKSEKKWGGINVRVMLDTNIFISTIFFPSDQTRELVKRLTENHQIVICDYVIEELRLVTERKFPKKGIFLERFFTELPFELVYTPKVLDLDEFPEMRDTKDSPILATAIMEEIDVFLTGEKDFLDINTQCV
jgi:putative PIN family toxin of toxin-antitoxin system